MKRVTVRVVILKPSKATPHNASTLDQKIKDP